MLHALFVHVGDADAVVAADVFVNAGDAEAAFVAEDFIPAALQDVGIDEGFAEACAIGVCLGVGIAVDDEEADVAPDLGGGKPDAVGFVHGLEHVGDEFFESRIVGGDVF